MLKKICLCLSLIFLSAHTCFARDPIKTDSILTILKIDDPDLKEKELILYIRYFFGNYQEVDLNRAKKELNDLLLKYDVENREGLNYFVEAMYQARLSHLDTAKSILIKTIVQAVKTDDHYLLYACFTHLGFIQVYRGHIAEAISSFGRAKKEAIILDDGYLKVLIDINLSDTYYKNNFYSQSLYYLDQAQALIARYHIKDDRINNAIYNNRAENYFRMGDIDSLKKYGQILSNTKGDNLRLYAYKKRVNYYLDLLNGHYQQAIKNIRALRHDSFYSFDQIDEQNLADAWLQAGRADSAKLIFNRLLADPAQNNHPEIKSHLYEALASIAEKENNGSLALLNFKTSLQQSKEQISRLSWAYGNVSQIKLDEMQSTYIRKVETYKRQRLLLIFAVVVAALAIVIGAMLYRNIKQKRHFEKLLYTTKREELAFINSHEIRRHLSNILGIIDVIRHSEDKHKEYLQAEDHLLRAAEDMDTAIKNISTKLDDHI